MSLEQSPTSSYIELKRKAMQAFFFDDNDLPFNRDGRLSDKQKRRFIMTSRAGLAAFMFSGLVLSALFVWTWEEPLDQLPWVIPAFMVMSFTAIGIYVYWLNRRVYKSGIVESAIGTAIFEKRLGEVFLQIGGKYFRSERRFRKIFVSDVRYKIYYAPSDNTIISVEILE